jgi:hypothetical protein
VRTKLQFLSGAAASAFCDFMNQPEPWPGPARWIAGVLLSASAMFIGLYRLHDSGPLWPDSPRYTNGAAMIRDWIDAGFVAKHPVRFAEANYRQYPAFSIPYHPPGYPAALALAFEAFGETYTVARTFIAVCWAMCTVIFLRILRELGVGFAASVAAAFLFVTTPQLAMWSRDTMSEVPSLTAILAGSVLWIRWCHGRGTAWLAGAIGLAMFGFFCRITAAGVLPAWALYAVWAGRLTLKRGLVAAGFGGAYLAIGVGWIAFSRPYATFELTADGKGTFDPMHLVNYFDECGVRIFLAGTTAATLLALAFALRRVNRSAFAFWFAWLLSYLLFKALVSTSHEPRHFFTALLALAGLAAAGFDAFNRYRLALAFTTAIGVGLNLAVLSGMPTGLTGYEAIGSHLATLDRPGNVLLAVPEDQELIFQFRSHSPAVQRQCVRSDRALAVRTADYTKQKATVYATTPEDLLRTLERGRIRYLVSFEPDADQTDPRPSESILVQNTASSRPSQFKNLGCFPLARNYVDYSVRFRGSVHIWEYLGELPPGPSELPVPIPTANLVIGP